MPQLVTWCWWRVHQILWLLKPREDPGPGTPCCPPRGAGRGSCGETCLHLPVQAATPETSIQKEQQNMGGWNYDIAHGKFFQFHVVLINSSKTSHYSFDPSVDRLISRSLKNHLENIRGIGQGGGQNSRNDPAEDVDDHRLICQKQTRRQTCKQSNQLKVSQSVRSAGNIKFNTDAKLKSDKYFHDSFQ